MAFVVRILSNTSQLHLVIMDTEIELLCCIVIPGTINSDFFGVKIAVAIGNTGIEAIFFIL